jgi:chromosome segregation ATPase
MVVYVQDRVKEATANGTTGEDAPKTRTRQASRSRSRSQKTGRFERANGGTQAEEAQVSVTELLERLEAQAGQIALLQSKLEEATKALEDERAGKRVDRDALAEERAARERLEGVVKREQAARKQAEETLEESRATATALEAQHHLLRAQLKALEKKRRGLLGRR